MLNEQLLAAVLDIASDAGKAIMRVYNRGDFAVETKQDNSPLTEADRLANTLIVTALGKLTPELPVLSEESAQVPFAQRCQWSRYWLVDPLDGTKEFIKRNGEFTVNIALIDQGVPVLGVVHVPVQNLSYAGALAAGTATSRAWKIAGDGKRQIIRTRNLSDGSTSIKVVASRSHRDSRLDQVLERIRGKYPEIETVSMGSSLKICLVAEGVADLYPRLAPTSEWDTAAAHAVLSAAGGQLVNTAFKELRYNGGEGLLNPWFIALGDNTVQWQSFFSGLQSDPELDRKTQ